MKAYMIRYKDQYYRNGIGYGNHWGKMDTGTIWTSIHTPLRLVEKGWVLGELVEFELVEVPHYREDLSE